jgi:hypothetical protein
MLRPMTRLLASALVLAATAACGDDDPTPTTPTPPPTTTTEQFNGTLTVNGAATHTFSATRGGQIRLILTAVAPDSSAVIGLSLGTWNAVGNTCAVVLSNDAAVQDAVVIGTAGQAGSFCARVYDVGRLSAPADYTLSVEHF